MGIWVSCPRSQTAGVRVIIILTQLRHIILLMCQALGS